jgi:hypothetical protein
MATSDWQMFARRLLPLTSATVDLRSRMLRGFGSNSALGSVARMKLRAASTPAAVQMNVRRESEWMKLEPVCALQA